MINKQICRNVSKTIFHQANIQLTQNQAQSGKKKLFSRKPGVGTFQTTVDKKKMVTEISQLVNFNKIEKQKNESNVSSNLSKLTYLRKSRGSDFFQTEKVIQNPQTAKKHRELFYSPKIDKADMSFTLSSYQRNNSKRRLDTSLANQPSFQIMPNKTKPERVKSNSIFEESMIGSTINGWKTKNYSTISLANQSSKNLIGDKKDNDSEIGISQSECRSVTNCMYCQNHRKMTDLLNKKMKKLEDQVSIRDSKITQLNNQLQISCQQKETARKKKEAIQQQCQRIEKNLCREKEDICRRYEEIRKDYSRITDKLKYLQIENAMLLRYKDEYQLLTREYDQLKAQNEYFRRQCMSQYESKHSFHKNKSSPAQRRNVSNHIANQRFKKKQDHQDDDISLDLSSEHSYQQF